MVNQLTALMLSKSVVGEEHTIDTENIKVHSYELWDQQIFSILCRLSQSENKHFTNKAETF